MRLCFLVLGCAIAASAWPVEKSWPRVHGVNGWFVPQKEGGLRWVGKSQAERQLEFYEAQDALDGRLLSNAVDFYLYTQQNPKIGQKIKVTKASIDASFFNSENPTRITIHGWNSNYKDGVNTRVADVLFQQGDFNIIAVDWYRGRSLTYATSVSGTPGAGKKIAALVDFLVKNYGMRLETLEIIGHSLGSHVAGQTGKQVTTGKVGRIVGLDPASPLINYSNTEKRLSSDDAVYVESIQTNGAILGFTEPIGRAAFYMNGGKYQPGCVLDVTGSCSHMRALSYYVEALLWNNFPSVKCESYQDANNNACGNQYSSILMGASVNTYVAFGIFYVPVHSRSPYGFGNINNGGEDKTTTAAVSTTTKKPEEPSTTTEEPEPEEPSTLTKEPEESTTEAPENGGDDNTTAAPEGGEDESTTKEPEEISTEEPEESTTEAPENGGDDDTTAAPESGGDESTTEEPEEVSTEEPEESTTEVPENGGDNDTTAAPESGEDESTTEEPEEVSTEEPEESTTEAPENGGEDDTTAAPEGGEDESTTEEPEEVSTTTEKPEEDSTTKPTTTGEPEEVSTATDLVVPSSTESPTELPSTTRAPTTVAPVNPTTSPPKDDDVGAGGTKNIFIFNVFLVNVKVKK